MLFLGRTQQTLASKRRTPSFLQIFKRKSQRIPFRKHQEGMAGNQFLSHLSRQFPEETFGAIAANGNPKAFSDNNAYAARTCFCLADQQIKAGGGHSPAMLFDVLDVPASAEKERPISSTLGHVRFIE